LIAWFFIISVYIFWIVHINRGSSLRLKMWTLTLILSVTFRWKLNCNTIAWKYISQGWGIEYCTYIYDRMLNGSQSNENTTPWWTLHNGWSQRMVEKVSFETNAKITRKHGICSQIGWWVSTRLLSRLIRQTAKVADVNSRSTATDGFQQCSVHCYQRAF
jgi:hypothetical protein